MDNFLFSDGQYICRYSDGEIKKYSSKAIEKYKNTAFNIEKSKSWKHSGEGAMFRGDVNVATSDNMSFNERINGVYLTSSPDEGVYSFTVNNTSGIYKMRFDDEKTDEIHIINSADFRFEGGTLDSENNTLITSLVRNYYFSDLAVFDLKTCEYKTITDGETLDDDPFISPEDGNIVYFSTRGAGRDMNGGLVKYGPASINKMNIETLEIKEVISSAKFNYFKPIEHGGKLYALKTPFEEKEGNVLIEILLIPFRILQAVANFINVFVTFFTGKSLVSGGSNPTKGRKFDSRQEFIKGNLINVEKEIKKNKKKNKDDYGFIPLSWQLVEIDSGNVIKRGVADYDILQDGTFITTNGKRIFAVKDGKTTKLVNTESCLKVAAKHSSLKKTQVFDI